MGEFSISVNYFTLWSILKEFAHTMSYSAEFVSKVLLSSFFVLESSKFSTNGFSVAVFTL